MAKEKDSAQKTIETIRRKTQRKHSAEEKIRIVLEGLRGEESIAELCRKHLDEIPVPPSQRMGKAFDPQFEALLLRCLEKDPAARPQSATELAQQLAAGPLAPDWRPAQRAAWWTAHRKSIAGEQKPKPLGSSPLEKTVKIAFADRTP